MYSSLFFLPLSIIGGDWPKTDCQMSPVCWGLDWLETGQYTRICCTYAHMPVTPFQQLLWKHSGSPPMSFMHTERSSPYKDATWSQPTSIISHSPLHTETWTYHSLHHIEREWSGHLHCQLDRTESLWQALGVWNTTLWQPKPKLGSYSSCTHVYTCVWTF